MPNPEKSIYIDGFALGGFRSFGHEPQYIYPCSKMNIIIGPNNSGKSNVLNFLIRFINLSVAKLLGNTNVSYTYSDHDKHQFLKESTLNFGVAYNIDNIKLLINRDFHTNIDKMHDYLNISKNNYCWFEWDNNQNIIKYRMPENNLQLGLIYEIYKKVLTNNPTIQENDPKIITNILNIYFKFLNSNFPFPPISELPTTRRQNKPVINKMLLGLQHPSPGSDYKEKKRKFDKINEFIKVVLDNNNVSIKIPNEQNINIEINGMGYSLQNLGTGIEETIIMASHCTDINNSIICIEEPEVHIHPRLQRKLIKYLMENTTNQYFIATHSAHIIDTDDISIFRVSMPNDVSIVENINSNHNKWNICKEIGYRASDIVQTNCIIWVEGPSDRIYINYWINKINPKLRDGYEYSIMFYGGRLLSHLSVNEESDEISEFISLLKINRNTFIIIDSDRKKESDDINDTKKRIRDGILNHWITDGREIENYMDKVTLDYCIKELYGEIKLMNPYGLYEKIYVLNDDKKETDKVKLAKSIVKYWEKNAIPLEGNLKVNLDKLIKFINEANSISC